MPEKCLFCGEIAVIEETVDDGRDELICVECGSVAADHNVIKPSDFTDEDDVELDDNEDESLSLDQSLSTVCISCGIDLDGNKTSVKLKLCSDCAELKEDENPEEEKATSKDTLSSVNSSVTIEQPERKSEEFDGKPKCSSCGSVNLIIDSVTGDDRLVCTDCGKVISDSILTTDAQHIPESSTSSRYHKATLPIFAERRKVQAGMTAGLTKISNLCSKFCFSSGFKTEAEDMYKRLYYHPRVLNVTVRKKEYISAMCLFIVCRQNDLPISLTHFKEEVNCFSEFIRAKKFVVKVLDIALPHMSMTKQLTEFLHHLKFDQKLTSKVKDILFLFRRAWLTQGRSREGLITLAAYYAYVSSTRCKKFITRNQFCAQHKLANVSREYALECQSFLCKLACSLPWVKSKLVSSKTLPVYINSILEYQESLFHLVFKPEENLCGGEPVQMFNSSESVRSASGRKPLRPCSQKERLLPSACKRQKIGSNSPAEVNYVVPKHINLDSPVLQENEFEEEINSYILTVEEQELIKKEKICIFKNRQ